MTFWSQPLEDYFPMEVLPGAHSTVTRWRKMARQFCSTGVDRRSARFEPWYFDPGNQRVQLGPGAVWVNGFYGTNSAAVVINTPGNDGIIVARFQPELQEVRLVFRPGAGIGGEIEDPDGWYETPLMFVRNDGFWQDLRRMVPIPWVPPPVTEMPPWVPRGLIGRAVGPGAPFPSGDPNAGGAGNVLVAYPATYPRWVSGRAYRFTLHTYWTSSGGSGQVRFWVGDTQGLRESLVLFNSFANSQEGSVRATSVVVQNVTGTIGTGEVVAVLSAEGGTPIPFMHWPALNSRIEVEDVGV